MSESRLTGTVRTYDIVTILTNLVGKGTPCSVTCGTLNVSDFSSFFKVACRTSVICSLVIPTSSLNSLRLHG